MRSLPFAVVAAVSLVGGVAVATSRPDPLEAALLGAVGTVLAGLFAGAALGLSAPALPEFDYTAAGSVLLVLSIFGLVALGGRPAGGYLAAVLGGAGAVLVGLDSGLERAAGNRSVADDHDDGEQDVV